MIDNLGTWYLSIAPSYPPGYWREPRSLERAQMEYEDEIAGGLSKWFPSLSLSGKDVHDLGCGYGCRSVRFAELGSRSVTGIESEDRQCSEAREFATLHNVAATFVAGSGERLTPLAQSEEIKLKGADERLPCSEVLCLR
jgi:2-polyprenyl-3-methyl-5-hydroxy-6-metoxy-1,4-benzoquinol methylase